MKIKFVTVATNLETGDPVTLDQGSIIAAIRASTALPGLVRPVHMNGLTLVDGGAAEPIPVKLAKRYHPQMIIAIDINQSLGKTIPVMAYGIYSRAQDIIWRRLTAYSCAEADIILRPEVGAIGTFALHRREQLVKLGEQTAQRELPKILQLLRQKHIALVGINHGQTQRSYT